MHVVLRIFHLPVVKRDGHDCAPHNFRRFLFAVCAERNLPLGYCRDSSRLRLVMVVDN